MNARILWCLTSNSAPLSHHSPTPTDADDWLSRGSVDWPESQTVLVATELFGFPRCSSCKRSSADAPAPRSLRDFIIVLAEGPARPWHSSPSHGALAAPSRRASRGWCGREARGLHAYNGFASQLVDAIGAKVAHAFIDRGRRRGEGR